MSTRLHVHFGNHIYIYVYTQLTVNLHSIRVIGHALGYRPSAWSPVAHEPSRAYIRTKGVSMRTPVHGPTPFVRRPHVARKDRANTVSRIRKREKESIIQEVFILYIYIYLSRSNFVSLFQSLRIRNTSTMQTLAKFLNVEPT